MAVDPRSPQVQNQRRAVFRLVIISGVILVMTLTGQKAQERAAARSEAPPPSAPVAPSAAEESTGTARTWSPGARTVVPRPVETRTGTVAEVQPLPVPEAGPTDSGDVDAVLREVLSASLEEVVPDVRDCLHRWWMMDPNLAGEVELEFVLDREGLGEVKVLDHTGVPVGPLTCFASALYQADWPRVASEITVVQPFRFEN